MRCTRRDCDNRNCLRTAPSRADRHPADRSTTCRSRTDPSRSHSEHHPNLVVGVFSSVGQTVLNCGHSKRCPMSSADPTNTGNELFPNLLPEEPSSPPRKPRTRKPKSSQHPSESPAPEPPEPAPTLAPDPFWAKVDALWAKHGMPLRPKVIMRTDPKTGKTVFTNTDLVPELAPRQEGAQWAASPSSGESVTQPPEKSTAKIPNCDASSVFCGTSKTPSTPAVSGDDNDLHTKRPHEAHSNDFVTAKKAI